MRVQARDWWLSSRTAVVWEAVSSGTCTEQSRDELAVDERGELRAMGRPGGRGEALEWSWKAGC